MNRYSIIILCTSLMAAAGVVMQDRGVSLMAAEEFKKNLPLLDQRVPERLETASFGMG